MLFEPEIELFWKSRPSYELNYFNAKGLSRKRICFNTMYVLARFNDIYISEQRFLEDSCCLAHNKIYRIICFQNRTNVCYAKQTPKVNLEIEYWQKLYLSFFLLSFFNKNLKICNSFESKFLWHFLYALIFKINITKLKYLICWFHIFSLFSCSVFSYIKLNHVSKLNN